MSFVKAVNVILLTRTFPPTPRMMVELTLLPGLVSDNPPRAVALS